MNNSALIEAILFHKAESMTIKELSEVCGITAEQVGASLVELEQKLQGRGISLVRKDDEVMLTTSPETSDVIEKITKEELSRDLGRAGLETLSIILYSHPISRRDIDYIRGVKSSFILRNLSIRGIIEKIPDPKDSRTHLFRPTFEALRYLGISSIDELPDREKVMASIQEFKNQTQED